MDRIRGRDSDGKAMDMPIKGNHIHGDSVDVKALRSLMGRFLWFPMESGGDRVVDVYSVIV